MSSGAAASLSSVTSTVQSSAQPASTSFRQLEENINKWTIELEDLEKVFLNQATQVNRALIWTDLT